MRIQNDNKEVVMEVKIVKIEKSVHKRLRLQATISEVEMQELATDLISDGLDMIKKKEKHKDETD